MRLQGIFNILATPFEPGSALDESSLRRLVDFQLDAGVAGLTILGIMGEAHKLLDEERLAIVRTVLDQVAERVPVVVGVSAGGADTATWFSRRAADLGAAAVMAAPPTNLRNLEAVYEYYRRLNAESPLPVVVQDEPVSTGVVMPAAFLARICDELERCVAIKLEEAPTPVKLSAVHRLAKRRVPIFGGLGGAQFYYELRRGAAGTMTGFAFPEILVAIQRRYAEGDDAGAYELFARYLPLISYEAQPVIGIALRKELLRRRGAIAWAGGRHPWAALDEGSLEELTQITRRVGLEAGVPGLG